MAWGSSWPGLAPGQATALAASVGWPVRREDAAEPAWLSCRNALAPLAWTTSASRERPSVSPSRLADGWPGVALPSGLT